MRYGDPREGWERADGDFALSRMKGVKRRDCEAVEKPWGWDGWHLR